MSLQRQSAVRDVRLWWRAARDATSYAAWKVVSKDKRRIPFASKMGALAEN